MNNKDENEKLINEINDTDITNINNENDEMNANSISENNINDNSQNFDIENNTEKKEGDINQEKNEYYEEELEINSNTIVTDEKEVSEDPEKNLSDDKNLEQNNTKENNRKTEKSSNSHVKETIKHKNKPKKFGKIVAIVAAVSVLGGGSIGASFALTKNYLDSKKSGVTATYNEPILNTSSSKASSSSNDAVEIIKQVSPSVVSITTKTVSTATYFNGLTIPYESEGAGSGVIFHEDDEKVYIVTNAHVVGGATEVMIYFTGSDNGISGKTIGINNDAEVAIVSVLKSDLEKEGITEITVARFGDSDDLEVGESVIAIGNALGKGKVSTGGMISAIGKEINVDGKTLNVIQTDAAINPGNSGGALVNYSGEVVGINTAKTSVEYVEGMGYAIPSSTIIPIAEQLLEEGTMEKPYLGILGKDVSEELSNLYGLPVGAYVSEVIEGGSADKAGIQSSDIIVGLGDDKILSMEDLSEALAKHKVGETVEVKLIRNGNESKTVKVVLQDANKQ